MADMIVEGAKALDASLEGIKDSVRKRIMRGSVNRALTIVGREIRKSVPPAKTPGHNMRRVKKSVGTRRLKSKLDTEAGKAGLRVGSREKATIAPHAHFIPLGTEERRTKSGAYRGRVRPRGFVPQAFARAEPKAVQEMQKTFEKKLKREWEKQKLKNKGKG